MKTLETILFGAILLSSLQMLYADGLFSIFTSCCGRKKGQSTVKKLTLDEKMEKLLEELRKNIQDMPTTDPDFDIEIRCNQEFEHNMKHATKAFKDMWQKHRDLWYMSRAENSSSYRGLVDAYDEQFREFRKTAHMDETTTLRRIRADFKQKVHYIHYIFRMAKTDKEIDTMFLRKCVQPFEDTYKAFDDLENKRKDLLAKVDALAEMSIERRKKIKLRASKAHNSRNDQEIEMDQLEQNNPHLFIPKKEEHIKVIEAIINVVGIPLKSLTDEAIDIFMEIAAIKFDFNMIRLYEMNAAHLTHTPKHDLNKDDVRVLYDGNYEETQSALSLGHYICAKYEKSSGMLYYYDTMYSKLDKSTEKVLKYFYSDKVPTQVQLGYKQRDQRSCGLYALANAYTLLSNKKPENLPFKVNDVFGDEALHLRLHFMEVLAKGLATECPYME